MVEEVVVVLQDKSNHQQVVEHLQMVVEVHLQVLVVGEEEVLQVVVGEVEVLLLVLEVVEEGVLPAVEVEEEVLLQALAVVVEVVEGELLQVVGEEEVGVLLQVQKVYLKG